MKRELMFAIRKDTDVVFIDNKGERGSVDLYYAYERRFNDGYCPFVATLGGDPAKRVYGFMDKSGKPTMLPFVKSADDFREGMARVNYKDESLNNNRYGYLDVNLQIAIPALFRKARRFSEGVASVSVDGDKYGVIDKEGNWVIKPNFFWIGDFVDGVACAEGKEGMVGFINKEGWWVIDPIHNLAESLGDKMICVHDENHMKALMTTTGELVTGYEFTDIGKFNDGVAPASKGKLWGYIDTKGEWVCEPKYHRAHEFSEGRAVIENFIPNPFKAYGRIVAHGLIDRDFNVIVEPKHREIGKFKDGYAHVYTFESWGKHSNYMDKQGNLFVEE